MKILFDQGTPRPLSRYLATHTVDMVYKQGWSTLKNGALLATAENAGYDLLVTTDQNLRYQQNLAGRRIAIVVLGQVDRVQQAVDNSTPGDYQEITFDTTP